jgi:hypothetical protein
MRLSWRCSRARVQTREAGSSALLHAIIPILILSDPRSSRPTPKCSRSGSEDIFWVLMLISLRRYRRRSFWGPSKGRHLLRLDAPRSSSNSRPVAGTCGGKRRGQPCVFRAKEGERGRDSSRIDPGNDFECRTGSLFRRTDEQSSAASAEISLGKNLALGMPSTVARLVPSAGTAGSRSSWAQPAAKNTMTITAQIRIPATKLRQSPNRPLLRGANPFRRTACIPGERLCHNQIAPSALRRGALDSIIRPVNGRPSSNIRKIAEAAEKANTERQVKSVGFNGENRL